MLTMTAKSERPIIVSRAHAETIAPCVEADERQEDDLQGRGGHSCSGVGLGDAVPVISTVRTGWRERHATIAMALDARQKDLGAATHGERDEGRGIDFFGYRDIQR